MSEVKSGIELAKKKAGTADAMQAAVPENS
jgi:hypothetical protein